MSAIRRVPTAADVERHGFEWWVESTTGRIFTVELEVIKSRDKSEVIKARTKGYVPAEKMKVAWLGPVNPEPLDVPWGASPQDLEQGVDLA